MNNAALRSNVGGITLSGASISGTGTINTTGAANGNGGNISITGTSAAGSINLTGAMTTTGGTAAAGTRPQRRQRHDQRSGSSDDRGDHCQRQRR